MFLTQREGSSGGRRKSASPAGECTQDQVLFSACLQLGQNESRGLHPCLIRYGVPSLHDTDLFKWDRVTIFYGDPALSEAISKNILKRFGHGSRCFSKPGHDDSCKRIEKVGVLSHFQSIF